MIALLVGRQLIKDEELLENLFIITLDKERQMEIIKQIDMASIEMSQACKRIQFDKRNFENLIMLTEYDIKLYNYKEDKMSILYDY